MDLSFSATQVKIEPNTGHTITVEVDVADASNVLDQFEVNTIVASVGYEKLLDAMDIEDVKKHLGLVAPE